MLTSELFDMRRGQLHSARLRVLTVAVLILCLSLLGGALAAPVTGRVFLDVNGNGAYDVGETGVADCFVADEQILVRTDAEGRYKLEAPAGPAVVFVVNRPGTWPEGSWWAYLPDGAAGGTLDFALRREDQPSDFFFVQGTDIHLREGATDLFDAYVHHVNALEVPVAFVVHTGDLVIDTNRVNVDRAEVLFDLYDSHVAALRPPLRNLPGNHEHVGVFNDAVAETDPSFGKGAYRQRYGPMTYVFRYGPCHFIALDGTILKGRSPTYGLTEQSASWAEAYLATVGVDEPIVLMVHEPLENRPTEQRLAKALENKKLLATLCGHGHGRVIRPWSGVPQIMGGAVSYAWHGLLPFPPDPFGYVLYHVTGEDVEWVFLDYQEERSFDVAEPGYGTVTSGRQVFEGVVSDLKGEITVVEVLVAGKAAHAALTRRGALAQAFKAEIDLSDLEDGFYEVVYRAHAGDRSWQEVRPMLVVNGKPATFQAQGPARLRFRIAGVAGPGNRVLLNGQELMIIPADAVQGKELSVDVPQERLQCLNAVTFRAASRDQGYDRLTVSHVWLDYDGFQLRDLRFPPSQLMSLRTRSEGQAPEQTFYIDLAYQGGVSK